MKTNGLVWFCVLVIGITMAHAGVNDPQETKGRAPVLSAAPVVSASLFKNGLALITREIQVPPKQDQITIAADPVPLHGSFWIESDTRVKIESREAIWTETKTVDDGHFDITRALQTLQGKTVTLFFGAEKLKGSLIPLTGLDTRLVALKTDKGTELIDSAAVSRVLFEEDEIRFSSRKKEKSEEKRLPILIFSFQSPVHERKLRFSYLCHGAAWAPAYRLDLSGDHQGILSFQGTIRNEILPFRQTRIFLVSGYPALMFGQTVSPLHRGQRLDSFLTQIGNPGRSGRAAVTQQVISNFRAQREDLGASGSEMQDLDSDIHVRSAGVVDLDVGDALQLDLGRSETTLERVVEWTIPESRDQEGRFQSQWRDIQKGVSPHELWDTLILSNPFDFPMTTAPVSVYQNGQILSQNLSYWTARGQKSRIRSGRALNIATDLKEEELASSRKRINLDGDDYQRSEIRCEITLINRRPTVQKLLIKRSVWGQVHSLTGGGQKRQLAEGARSQNPRTEVEWNIELAAGQKTELAFTYIVLTDI